MWRRVETALRSARRAPRSPDLAIVAIGANCRICPGPELSHDFTHGQDQDAARVDEEGRRVRPLQNAAFCAQVEAGPECSRSSRRTELEQWTGGRTHQSAEDTEAPDVWPSRI